MSRGVKIALVLVLLSTLLGAFRGMRSRKVPGDFLRYHRAGRMVVTGEQEHLYDRRYMRKSLVYAQERADEAKAAEAEGRKADPLPEREYKYLPATAVLLAPFGALHPRAGNVLWASWNGFLVALLFVVAWRACARGRSGWWMLPPFLALAHATNDNVNLGQLNPSAIVPATVALALLCMAPSEPGPRRRRADIAAGLLLAFGAIVKFMPFFLWFWLLWKRRFLAAGVMLAGIVGLGWGLPALVFGPTQSTELIQEYVDVRAHHYTGTQKKDFPGFSIKSFAYRVVGGQPYIRTGRSDRAVNLDVSIVELPGNVVYWLVMALNLLVLAAVAIPSWGPLRGGGDPRGPPEAGLALASLLLISPEARGPHFLYLALPAVALTYGLVAIRDRGGVRPRWWKPMMIGCAVGAVLLYGNSGTLFRKTGSAWMSALCSLGLASVICFVGLVLVRAQFGRDDDPVGNAPPGDAPSGDAPSAGGHEAPTADLVP